MKTERLFAGFLAGLIGVSTQMASAQTSGDSGICSLTRKNVQALLEKAIEKELASTTAQAGMAADLFTGEQSARLRKASPAERDQIREAALAARTAQSFEKSDQPERKFILFSQHNSRVGDRTVRDEVLIDPADFKDDSAAHLHLLRRNKPQGNPKVLKSPFFLELPGQAPRVSMRKLLEPGSVDDNLIGTLQIAASGTEGWQDKRFRMSAITVSMEPNASGRWEPSYSIEGMVEGNEIRPGLPNPERRGKAIRGSLDEVIQEVYLGEHCPSELKKQKDQSVSGRRSKPLDASPNIVDKKFPFGTQKGGSGSGAAIK
jgi:hypothetical protein